MGDWGSSPQNFFWFKWCKIVCLRQNKHRNGTFVKACDSVHDWWTDNHFELGSDSNFSNIYTMYNTGERNEPEKNYKNKIKSTFGSPLLPIKYPHKTPPLKNLRGGGGPDPRSPPPPSGSAHDFVWLRITDEGSVPEMRIWSILLIKSDLKWCIHLNRSLFLYTVDVFRAWSFQCARQSIICRPDWSVNQRWTLLVYSKLGEFGLQYM